MEYAPKRKGGHGERAYKDGRQEKSKLAMIRKIIFLGHNNNKHQLFLFVYWYSFVAVFYWLSPSCFRSLIRQLQSSIFVRKDDIQDKNALISKLKKGKSNDIEEF